MKVVVDYVHNLNLSWTLHVRGERDLRGATARKSWLLAPRRGILCIMGGGLGKDGLVPHRSGLDPRETYPLMADALNRSSRHIALNMFQNGGLRAPWEWGFNVAQSWRMGHDHVGTWASTKAMIRASAGIPASGSGEPYGWNDMDMLQTRERAAGGACESQAGEHDV